MLFFIVSPLVFTNGASRSARAGALAKTRVLFYYHHAHNYMHNTTYVVNIKHTCICIYTRPFCFFSAPRKKKIQSFRGVARAVRQGFAE